MFNVSFKEQNQAFSTSFSNTQVILDVQDKVYEGDYEITPKVESQIMKTQGLMMKDDVSIKSIPCFKVSNEYGGETVWIGEKIDGN